MEWGRRLLLLLLAPVDDEKRTRVKRHRWVWQQGRKPDINLIRGGVLRFGGLNSEWGCK